MPQYLFDNLDNPVRARIDQNRAAVHDGVAIVPGAIFRRHVVIGDAVFRQHRADPDILVILIGRTVLLDDVAAEAGTIVHPQHPVDAPDHAANDAADHGTDRTGRSFAFP